MNWLISANGDMYNHDGAFERWGFIDWRQIYNYEIGDLVYIYRTVPIQSIQYKCVVEKVNLDRKEIVDDYEFWYDKNVYYNDKKENKKFTRLRLVKTIPTELLSFNNLKKHGLRGELRGGVKLDSKPQLLEYIERSFNEDSLKVEISKILYCRIGMMRSYNGIQNDSRPIGGGAYNKDNIGHEIYNFANNDGTFYGFVQSKSNRINIKRIDSSISNKENFIEDVLVVWVATKEKFGQCIVGWYQNATVYKNMQRIPKEIIEKRIKAEGSDYDEYLIKSNNATLVLDNRRNEKIIGMGEANVWYGDDNTNKQVVNYINNYNNNIAMNIEEISDFKELTGKEKEAIVKIRENQSAFRTQLLRIFPNCCLCHMENKNLLIASHIKPWAKSNSQEKLSRYNGLLLCPNHDKVFDNGFISFNDDGKIMISKKLSSVDRILLNLHEDMKIDVNSDNIEFVRYHRNNIYYKEKN